MWILEWFGISCEKIAAIIPVINQRGNKWDLDLECEALVEIIYITKVEITQT